MQAQPGALSPPLNGSECHREEDWNRAMGQHGYALGLDDDQPTSNLVLDEDFDWAAYCEQCLRPRDYPHMDRLLPVQCVRPGIERKVTVPSSWGVEEAMAAGAMAGQTAVVAGPHESPAKLLSKHFGEYVTVVVRAGPFGADGDDVSQEQLDKLMSLYNAWAAREEDGPVVSTLFELDKYLTGEHHYLCMPAGTGKTWLRDTYPWIVDLDDLPSAKQLAVMDVHRENGHWDKLHAVWHRVLRQHSTWLQNRVVLLHHPGEAPRGSKCLCIKLHSHIHLQNIAGRSRRSLYYALSNWLGMVGRGVITLTRHELVVAAAAIAAGRGNVASIDSFKDAAGVSGPCVRDSHRYTDDVQIRAWLLESLQYTRTLRSRSICTPSAVVCDQDNQKGTLRLHGHQRVMRIALRLWSAATIEAVASILLTHALRMLVVVPGARECNDATLRQVFQDVRLTKAILVPSYPRIAVVTTAEGELTCHEDEWTQAITGFFGEKAWVRLLPGDPRMETDGIVEVESIFQDPRLCHQVHQDEPIGK